MPEETAPRTLAASMTPEPSVALCYVRLLTDYCTREGLDIDSLCATAGIGLPPISADAEEQRIPFRNFMTLCNHASISLGDDGLGFRLGQAIRPGYYGIHGHGVMCARTFGECLDRSIRFHTLVHDGGRNQLLQEGDQLAMVYRSNLHGLEDLGRLQNELCITGWVAFARWVVGLPNYSATEICFTHPAPVDQAIYQEWFDCPVHFNQARNAAIFPASLLAIENPQANPTVLRILDDLAERTLLILQPANEPDWLLQARHQISTSLHDGLPTQEQVARLLGMSSAEFRYALKKRNLLFTQLLEDTRLTLAQGYLRDPELRYTDISFMLGFSEQSAFNRAFKRWTGMTPRQYRMQHA